MYELVYGVGLFGWDSSGQKLKLRNLSKASHFFLFLVYVLKPNETRSGPCTPKPKQNISKPTPIVLHKVFQYKPLVIPPRPIDFLIIPFEPRISCFSFNQVQICFNGLKLIFSYTQHNNYITTPTTFAKGILIYEFLFILI